MMQYKLAEIYPEDAVSENSDRVDAIDPASFTTIPAVFKERIRRSADRPAYLYHEQNSWKTISWGDFDQSMSRWQKALTSEGLAAGDRVAIRLKNCKEWVIYDQATMAQGLVVVPVFAEDRADNIAYIINSTDSKILLVENLEQWQSIANEAEELACLQRVVLLEGAVDGGANDPRIVALNDWLASGDNSEVSQHECQPDDLATIVFTSGTTGKPKGVMLSHANILSTAYGGLQSIAVYPEDKMLSFLPLSHMFERTIGCYLNVLAGSSVAFSRSIPELLEDMAQVKPTIIITVPRIFERAYSRIRTQLDEGSAIKRWLFEKAVEIGWQAFEEKQGRAHNQSGRWALSLLDKVVGQKVRQRFGGNLRFVVSGGAPLAARISKVFIGLGIDILQGYGLTETSPVPTVNTQTRNKPDSIGLPLACAQLRIAEDGELQANGPSIMLGYWQNPEATAATMTEDGWLKTGDVASISEQGFISITGRIKEIIVLANGEKVPPTDMEAAICDDSLYEQAMVVGEGKGFLSLLTVIDADVWNRLAPAAGFGNAASTDFGDEDVAAWHLKRIAKLIEDFPGYANIRAITVSLDPWTVEDGALTPTMKIKRPVLRQRFDSDVERMYEGH